MSPWSSSGRSPPPATRHAELSASSFPAPALALARGGRPTIRSAPDADAPASLQRLDTTIARRLDVHLGSTLIIVCSVLGLSLIALATRSPFVGRAALLATPAALAASLV